MYRKNTASQFLYFQLNKASDGTGLTGATVSVRRCIDGTFAAATGSVTEDTGGGSSAGFYKFAMSQGDTNGNNIGYAFSATGAITVEKTIVTTAADPTDAVHFGLSALPNAAANAAGGLPVSIAGALDLDEMNVDIEAIQTSTAGLTFTVANQLDANVLDWKSATAPAMTGDAFARLGAPAGASVSADVAAIKTDLDAGVNTVQIAGSTAAASNVSKANQAIVRGVCSGGSVTTAICSSITTPASLTDTGQLFGRTIIFDSNTATGNLQGQASQISANTTGATPTITFAAMSHAPANGDTFSVV